MNVLTNEQAEELSKISLREVEGEEDEFFDILISYAVPEWPDMEDEERYTFFHGFIRGYLSCLELHKYIVFTRGGKKK